MRATVWATTGGYFLRIIEHARCLTPDDDQSLRRAYYSISYSIKSHACHIHLTDMQCNRCVSVRATLRAQEGLALKLSDERESYAAMDPLELVRINLFSPMVTASY